MKIKVSVPINQDGKLRKFEIIYSPTIVRKLNEWSNVADIHWLTSWGERANTHLAPAIGLEGSFATLPYDVRDNNNEEGGTKLDCAQAFAEKMHPDQLVIWLEDDLSTWVKISTRSGGLPSSPEKCPACDDGVDVLVRPNTMYVAPSYGLTPAHVELVDKYLADPALAKDKLIYAFDRYDSNDGSTTVWTFTKQMMEATPLVHANWCPQSRIAQEWKSRRTE